MKNEVSSPIYDINKSFEYNVTYGPFFDGELPSQDEGSADETFIGIKVHSLFGIAACPLTSNARFVELMSHLGFDILTYKSVRSIEWHGNAFPHWLYANMLNQLTLSDIDQELKTQTKPFENDDVTMANSFGVHSLQPRYWQGDFEDAQQKMGDGKVLILSLMPTPIEGQTLVDDASTLGKLGAQTSAKVFEINLACPNTDGGKGLIYEDLDLSLKLCTALKKEIGERPLIVKVGYFKDQEAINFFMKSSKGIIAGFSSANTYARKVTNNEGKGAFPGRPMAGISGSAIRTLSLQQAENIAQYRDELGLKDFVLIGIGGVTKPEHIDAYLRIGSNAVQTAVGAWADPYLAQKYKKEMYA